MACVFQRLRRASSPWRSVDLYATGDGHGPLSNGELRETIHDLCAACREILAQVNGAHNIDRLSLAMDGIARTPRLTTWKWPGEPGS